MGIKDIIKKSFLTQFKKLYTDKDGLAFLNIKQSRAHKNICLLKVDGIDTILVYHGVVLQHLAQTVDNLSVVGRLCQQVVADGTGGNVKVGKNCSLLIFLGSEGEVTLGVHEAHYTGQLACEAHGIVVVLKSLVAGHEE